MSNKSDKFEIAEIDFSIIYKSSWSPGELLITLKILSNLKPLKATILDPMFK